MVEAMNRKMIFIIGAGRSGTHFLAEILQSHPKMQVTVEDRRVFRLSKDLALKGLFDIRVLIQKYREMYEEAKPYCYADKSHPNIWHVESLKTAFPGALFLGIYRNPYAVVSSMLKHQGIVKMFNLRLTHQIAMGTSGFYGITEKNKWDYLNYSLERRLTLSWQSHYNRLMALNKLLKDKLLVIKYESLLTNTPGELIALQDFIGLKTSFPLPKIKLDSLNKWRRELTDHQKNEIKSIVGDMWGY